jgi:hypothetical protein
MILSSILKWDWLLARLASILSAYGPSYIHWANHTTDRRVVAPHDYLRMLSGRCSARCNAVLARKETAWSASRRDRPTELHGPVFRNSSKVSARRGDPFRPCEIILVERAQVWMRAAARHL